MKNGAGCLTVFGGVFFLAGLGIFIWGLLSSYDVWRAQSWQPVDAKITSLELVTSTGDNSTSYGVKGSYQYLYQGNTHQSNQINFYPGTDNIGSYQKDLHRKLQRARNNHQSVTAYVNPNEPSESVLDRTMRWGMLGFQSIFLFVFGGVGLGIMLWSRWGAKALQEVGALKESHPEEPWLWRKEWQGQYFKNTTKNAFKFIAFFAVIWNLISLPATIAVIHEGNLLREPLKLLVFLFTLVGLIMIGVAVLYYLRDKKYGESKVELQQTPLAIGGKSSGSVIINSDISQQEVMLTLSCQRVVRRRTGKETRTTTTIIWQDDQRLQAKQTQQNEYRVDFNVNIPEGLPESSDKNPSNKIEWVLKVEQKQKGPDLKLMIELPAFVVAHRLDDEPLTEDLFSHADDSQETAKGGDWRYLGIVESYNNYGKEYYFKPFRHKGLGIATFLFGLIFTSIGVGIFIADTSWLFLIAFGGIGLLVLLIGVNVMLFRSRIITSSGVLHCRKGAIIPKTYRFNIAEIDDIVRDSNMSSGDKRYYHVAVKTTAGKKEVIAKHLLNSNDVDDFIAQLKSDIGYR
ncbi:hypothetical protein GCM10009123_05320 [Kangiella japonica]|uniref:DUF3592 domain-containing protein n=1 Tax=Kangiella japonica TaxID=647384 RepID=A0ABN0SUN8_9GAMM